MIITLIFIISILLIMCFVLIKINLQVHKLEGLKENFIEVIPNICLTKTIKYIGIKKEYYCYYNFTITNDFIILERYPNTFLFKEIPILILRNNNSLEFDFKNIFTIEYIRRNEINAIQLNLRSSKSKSYFLGLDINKSEPKLDKWIT